MPLPVGTAFQNGQYVIDAYGYDDDMGSLYLATEIATGQQVMIRAIAQTSNSEHFQPYLQQIAPLSRLNHPGIVAGLTAFVENERLYLAMAAEGGLSLAKLVQSTGPMSPDWAVRVLQQVAKVLELAELKGFSLRLTPDQVWWQPQTKTCRLSGFGLGDTGSIPQQGEADWGKSLAALLYYLLIGESIDQTQAPLVRFHQQHPELGSAFEPALSQGLNPAADFSLQQWIALLPEGALWQAPTRVAIAVPVAQVPVRHLGSIQPYQPASPQRTNGKLPLALAFTAVAASLAGFGFSLTWRLQPSEAGGGSRFDPKQDFPSLANWPQKPVDWPDSEANIDFDQPYRERRWSEPNRLEPYSNPPAEISPRLEPQPKADFRPDSLPAIDQPSTETNAPIRDPGLPTEASTVPKPLPSTPIEAEPPRVTTEGLPIAPAPANPPGPEVPAPMLELNSVGSPSAPKSEAAN